ncbi:uncharacterized protein LOC111673847 isoform X1 [Orussus abietinus]|uniref:uncharacterized protein LOC111673847 isoform X1 n=1 Tax=Orussus abietinus TaxID=222816 RepID=UPI000C715DEC|nr:uncharacterized protein LOC111673847 isoform X1 [Orussus abietinus]
MGTVIKVKHVDDINFRDGSHRQGSEEVPRNAIPHEKELLVNIDCPICIIINYIREVARLSESSEFDLCDETICQLRNIHSFVPDTPGLEVLQPNATYLILTYERKPESLLRKWLASYHGSCRRFQWADCEYGADHFQKIKQRGFGDSE